MAIKPTIWYIHVNRGIIDSNRKHGTSKPPITVRRGKSGKSWTATEIQIPGLSWVLYDPGSPILSCGARLVIATHVEPVRIK